MDEALLTGRFNVYPDMTRRTLSGKSSRVSSATTTNTDSIPHEEDKTPGVSREASARLSRSSSRADTCLRRSRSAFDADLFKRQLRLNKSLSRNRFKQELLDFAAQESLASQARDGSARAGLERDEPDGGEEDVFHGSALEKDGRGGGGGLEKAGRGGGGGLEKAGEVSGDVGGENRLVPSSERSVNAEKDAFRARDYEDDENSDKNDVDFNEKENVSQEMLLGGQAEGKPSGTLSPESQLSEEPSFHDPPLPRAGPPRRRRRRSESRPNVLTTHSASVRKDRPDGSVVINPQRHKTRFDVSTELTSPRRFSPRKNTPRSRTSMASSPLWFNFSSPSSEDEELTGLIGRTPSCHQRRRGGRGEVEEGSSGVGTPAKLGDGERMFHVYESDSDQYDTDFEVEEGSEFHREDRNRTASRKDTDFGHLTYEAACARFKVVARRRIIHQLTTQRLQVNFCGLSRLEAKALALGILNNHRLDEVDLSSNSMDGTSVAYIADCFLQNIFITKLNLSGNMIQEEGAKSLSVVLKTNTWVTHLNLADCGINDHDIAYLAKGMQENHTVVCLNLSKNHIGLYGGRHLGTAIGQNNGIECLNLSWNKLRGGGAVAVCNSLQRNNTIQELNLAWNGLGFQGSLAMGEALKVNQSITKLNISNNRVDWDCMPYLAKAMASNKTIQVLELGHNPISMEGCMKLLEAIDRPSSHVRFLSLAEIPISNTIAFKATEISKTRDFGMEHGGVISTRDIFGIKRIKREDPLTLLIRFLSTMGIRVVDLFRVFDTDSKLYVSEANFIRGLKRVRAPLEDDDMLRVARRMRSDTRGDISYQELAANVRNHIREERLEDQRLQRLENKKRQQRKRILQSDLPLYAPPSFSYDPALHNMYDSNVINRLEAAEEAGDFSAGPPGRVKRMESDVVSQRSSALAGSRRRRTPPAKVVLPGIDTPKRVSTARRRFRGIVERGVAMAQGRNTPMTLVRHGTKEIPGAPRPLYLLGASRPESKDRAVGTSDAGTRSGTPKGRGLSDTPQGMIRKGHGHIPPGMINSSTIFDAGSSAKGNRYRTPSHTEKSPPVLISKGHAHIPPGMIGSRSNTPKGMTNIPAGVSGSPRDGSRRNFDLGMIAKETLKEARNNSPQKGNRKGLGDIPPTQKGSRVDVAHSLTVPGQLPKESVSGGSKSKTKTAKQQAPASQSPTAKKASHSPTKLPDINATKSLVGGHPEKETTSGAGNKNRPERSLLTMSPDKSQIARARRGVEYTDENRRL